MTISSNSSRHSVGGGGNSGHRPPSLPTSASTRPTTNATSRRSSMSAPLPPPPRSPRAVEAGVTPDGSAAGDGGHEAGKLQQIAEDSSIALSSSVVPTKPPSSSLAASNAKSSTTVASTDWLSDLKNALGVKAGGGDQGKEKIGEEAAGALDQVMSYVKVRHLLGGSSAVGLGCLYTVCDTRCR